MDTTMNYIKLTVIFSYFQFNCSNKCPDWAPLKDTEESESGHVETLCIAEADSAHSKGSVNQ